MSMNGGAWLYLVGGIVFIIFGFIFLQQNHDSKMRKKHVEFLELKLKYTKLKTEIIGHVVLSPDEPGGINFVTEEGLVSGIDTSFKPVTNPHKILENFDSKVDMPPDPKAFYFKHPEQDYFYAKDGVTMCIWCGAVGIGNDPDWIKHDCREDKDAEER